MLESLAIVLLAVASCFLGFVLGLQVAAGKSKEGTPSASHNTARDEIGLTEGELHTNIKRLTPSNKPERPPSGPTSPVQQLKAEIAALIPDLNRGYNNHNDPEFDRAMDKLRQLSALNRLNEN